MDHQKEDDERDNSNSTVRPIDSIGRDNFENHKQSAVENYSIRESLAQSTHKLSDFVNEHLILIRYATLSSVILLGAYSISQSPLFFRYRSAKDIPISLYKRRRTLTCRVLKVESPSLHVKTTKSNDTVSSVEWRPIVLQLKHLSPAGQLLPREYFEFGSNYSPAAVALGRNDDPSDTIRVQLFGVMQDSETFYQRNQVLRGLSEDRSIVRCQLLAALITPSIDCKEENVSVVARLGYWPTSTWWPVDLGSSLVQAGLAKVEHELDYGRYSSESLEDKRRDIQYLESLTKLEHEAISKRSGIWSIPQVREASKDVVDHVDWMMTAPWYQKLWHRITGRY
jgi:hypothetical protein